MPTLYSLVIDNDGGTTTELFYTEAARDVRCHAICAEAWAEIATDTFEIARQRLADAIQGIAAGPIMIGGMAEAGTLIGMPDDWREAYAILDERGCDFWLSLSQHEIDIAQLVT